MTEINQEKGYQVGIHVDAASGGFVAPFQDDVPAWDFRLKNVLTISSSGHKFGESSCGTGWVVFRHRHDLSEHIEVEVTYLGGISYSMTLNFSRPATGIYVQAYKFLRMGMLGYKQKVKNQLDTTAYFREKMRDIKWSNGKPFFQICDPDDEPGLPVFACRVNPALDLEIDDFSIQHVSTNVDALFIYFSFEPLRLSLIFLIQYSFVASVCYNLSLSRFIGNFPLHRLYTIGGG